MSDRLFDRVIRATVAIGLLLFTAAPLGAGSLHLGTPVVDNNRYTFPVYLNDDSGGVAAIDFRLAYDPAVFNPVSANSGASAIQAQKQVSSNLAAPGDFVVVMMGFNQNSVRPGEVISVVMEKIGEPADGQSTLRIDEPTMATYEGVEMESRGQARTVRFGEIEKPKDKPGSEEEAPAEEGDAPPPAESQADGENDGMAPTYRSGAFPVVVAARRGAATNEADTPTPGASTAAETHEVSTAAGATANGQSDLTAAPRDVPRPPADSESTLPATVKRDSGAATGPDVNIARGVTIAPDKGPVTGSESPEALGLKVDTATENNTGSSRLLFAILSACLVLVPLALVVAIRMVSRS